MFIEIFLPVSVFFVSFLAIINLAQSEMEPIYLDEKECRKNHKKN